MIYYQDMALSLLAGIMGLVFIIWYFATKGFALNLDIVNFIFLFLAILFHGKPRNFLNALGEAVKGAGGIIHLFVPSGGGQWAVQAPVMIPASLQLGVPVAKTAMAVAWGDAWTNMIQPFWALARPGYCGAGIQGHHGLLYGGTSF